MSADASNNGLLVEILDGLKALQKENSQLASAVDAINGRVNMLAGVKQLQDNAVAAAAASESTNGSGDKVKEEESEKTVIAVNEQYERPPSTPDAVRRTSVSKTSKIILTSYPHQAGIDPLPMEWGHTDPAVRGPVVVSRHTSTIRRRNGMSPCCLLIYG